jgi:hypothetical protein
MRGSGHVACIEGMGNVYRILFREPEEMIHIGIQNVIKLYKYKSIYLIYYLFISVQLE